MNFENLNRKQKRRLAKFMTNENVKQSSNNFNLAFLRFIQDLNNNSSMLKKQNMAKSAVWSDVGVSLNLIKNNHR
tara:strand:+ start:75 stop:299 length:225 start_codon:yes stop_codon:yes gene_type:complete